MKITKVDKNDRKEIVVHKKSNSQTPGDWWNSNSKSELCQKMLGTVAYLKEQNQSRVRQASVYARLYGNLPLFSPLGTSFTKLSTERQMPIDRPTMSVITSCVDTSVSRLTQSRPRPVYLTDNSDYKQRNLAKNMNQFIMGELHRARAYKLGELAYRDACVLGDGVVKVLEGQDKKVALERRLSTELLCDSNDAFYGEPRQFYELKLIDRAVLSEMCPKYKSDIAKAESGTPDNSEEGNAKVSDQIIVAEGWHLRSGPHATDGLHVIVCSEGVIFEESWDYDYFPFEIMPYAPRMVGYWSQGIAERLMGSQSEINKLLITTSRSINLVGVPRILVEDGSKIVKSHFNNEIGGIITYRGTQPQFVVAPCIPAEVYAWLERIIQRSYQQEGLSEMTASSQKPAGLNSGEAQRVYDDIQQQRFAIIEKRYQEFYAGLASKMIDKAVEIAKRDGKYETVFPNKNGVREVNLPEWEKLESDTYVIQCYDESSLPNEPSGRLQKITEMMQGGIITPQEGRRLLNFPDTEQNDKLETAAEERVYQILDKIVEEGEYTPPDSFLSPDAEKIVVQYYNLYVSAKLEEDRCEMLRTFWSQLKAQQAQAMAASMPQGQPQIQPQANPMPAPQSELVQNVPGIQ